MVAHNALFEQVITRNVLARICHTQLYLRSLLPDRWLCTASLASALALPRKLEGAALALKLKMQKDMAGHKLMLKWSKPRKPSKNNPATRHTDPQEYQRLISYCATDLDVETELFLKCPPLTDKERKIWVLDQTINLRGFKVDRPLVKTVLRMISEETKELNRETQETFEGLTSTTQRDGVLRQLESGGVFLPNLKKKTVEDAIASGLATGDSKRLLEMRLAVSKTSTAKYIAFEQRSRFDGRLRDILIYHTASTGRWGGSGVQPQNFPRGTVKDTIEAAKVIADGDLEFVRLIYGDPMSVFSSCLRGMIVAPKGKILDVADYAAIEARVLFWVAKHEAGLRAFREGRDLYCELASTIFNRKVTKVDVKERFLGKEGTLGAGFGLGHVKFKSSCKEKGQEITEELAKATITAYRTTHKPVVELWRKIERAAVEAVRNPGKRYAVNMTMWFVKDSFLWCELPSGRRLAYYGPRVQYDTTPWGDKRAVLYHWGVDSLSKKWVFNKTYGGRLVENVVQAIARDLMAEAMLRIDSAGSWDLVLTVHDELIGERDIFSDATNKGFCDLMAEVPDWADGLPVRVEGWEGTRYRK